jgi:hypothetical protein
VAILINNNACITCEVLKRELVGRFSNHKKSDETLKRFLGTGEATTYSDYVNLLRDARIVKSTRGVNVEHIMRQVISRSPAGLKSLLLQVAHQCVGCEEFLRQAESAAWVVFPEQIIGRVENEIVGEENEIKRIDGGKRNSFF